MTTFDLVVNINGCEFKTSFYDDEFLLKCIDESNAARDFLIILYNFELNETYDWYYLYKFNAKTLLYPPLSHLHPISFYILELSCIWMHSQIYCHCNFSTWQFEYDHLISLENSSNASIWQIQSTWMAICDYKLYKRKIFNSKEKKKIYYSRTN